MISSWLILVSVVLPNAAPERLAPLIHSGTCAPHSIESTQIIIEGHRKPEEAAVSVSSIAYLPFDVPEGVTKIEIKIEHVEGEDKGIVELGIFDARGHGPGGPGFRGWQGTAPIDPTITGQATTTSPQYLAGPLPAGKWHLAQWYLKSSPDGLKYKYTINLSSDGPKPPTKFPAPPSFSHGASGEAKWCAGSIGARSIHSDGTKTVAELAAINAAAGFDFTVVADANGYSHHFGFADARQAHPNHLMIVGAEVATAFGHANVIGARLGHWFDFRYDAGAGELAKTIGEAHKQGAVFTVNNPFDAAPTAPWRFPEEEWADADAIEVWTGAWGTEDQQALEMWSRSLANPKKRFTMLGGTDYRKDGDSSSPAVWIKGRLSREGVIDGIRKGLVVLTQTPKMIPPTLTVGGKGIGETVKSAQMRSRDIPRGVVIYAPMELVAHVKGFKGHALHVRSAWGDVSFPQGVLIDSDDFKYVQVARPAGDGWYRLEIRSGDQANWGSVLALTNPVYSKR